MAAGGARTALRPRKALADIDIEEILNESEFDYSGDDSDDDPMFQPPQIARTAVKSESSSSSNEDENIPGPPVSPPISFTDVSEIATRCSSRGRSRGRARSSSRGTRGRGGGRGRGRGRGRGSSAPPPSPPLLPFIQTRATQDNWSKEHFEPEIGPLTQPAYKQVQYTDYEWYQFYDQYIDADILFQMIDATNRTHILNAGRTLGLTLRELRVYIGITLTMSALQYPQIDMYSSEKLPKVPHIFMFHAKQKLLF